MHQAQNIARRDVVPWLKTESEEGERQYREVFKRFALMGNEFLSRLAAAGIPELARMLNALDQDTGFRVRSEFRFRDFIQIAQPSSPVRRLGDVFLGILGLRRFIDMDARWFLEWLFEVNSSRVQNDVLNRIEESRNRLEVNIRRLLHEVSHIAEQALARAKNVRGEGASAIQASLCRLGRLDQEIRRIRNSEQGNVVFPARL
jgi:hypothetical protein